MSDERQLVVDRVLHAPRARVWRCWTEPELLKQWFCPKPWFVSEVRSDLRPGGEFFTRMNGPDGESHGSPGVWLEVTEGRRLVMTDAFMPDWQPKPDPFMVAIVEFADAGDGATGYRWMARHWTEAAKRQHEEMGFHTGWNAATDQLEALAKTL
ncbi:SRPBCC family protein [Zhengella sp. ZM62]|uniref:SRPBCC family protein n=1 Tax=Zhengella sedimenti TaxID=3390035 RepID=UPI0039767439